MARRRGIVFTGTALGFASIGLFTGIAQACDEGRAKIDLHWCIFDPSHPQGQNVIWDNLKMTGSRGDLNGFYNGFYACQRRTGDGGEIANFNQCQSRYGALEIYNWGREMIGLGRVYP
jgi:hypothetical protein